MAKEVVKEPLLYRLIEEIGYGGFGKVYKATEILEDAIIAIKVLHSEKMDEIGLKRFEREIKFHNQLDHKNVVPILDFSLGDDFDDIPYYTMPLARCNLTKLMMEYREDNLKPMDDAIASYYFEQLLDAMEYVHKEGVIHRDLNPRNILVYGDDNLKISDFGLGKLKNRDVTTLTVTRMGMGNDVYTAPEQWEQRDAKNVDERTDIYSLGKILYEMLTGLLPLNIDLDKIKDSKYKYLIKKATQINKEKRYSSIRQLRNDFDLLSGKKDYAFKNPSQKFNDSLTLFMETNNTKYINDMLDILITKNEYILYTKNFMTLDSQIIEIMSNGFRDKYSEVIDNYFIHIEGNHTYSFTDDIALFLLKIYSVDPTNDELFEKVFERLLTLAYDHNRFFIGERFSSSVSNINDPQLLIILLDIFERKVRQTKWMKVYLKQYALPDILLDYLDSI